MQKLRSGYLRNSGKNGITVSLFEKVLPNVDRHSQDIKLQQDIKFYEILLIIFRVIFDTICLSSAHRHEFSENSQIVFRTFLKMQIQLSEIVIFHKNSVLFYLRKVIKVRINFFLTNLIRPFRRLLINNRREKHIKFPFGILCITMS